MKKRSGFVTNSSSSSFIINKKHEFNSVEEVFQFMKTLYEEWKQKRDELIEFCKNDERYVVVEEDDFVTIQYKKTKPFSNEWSRWNRELKEKFGMCHYVNLNYNLSWLTCKTYDEFIAMTDKTHWYIFHIIDFSNPNQYVCECGDDMKDIIGWYMPCFGAKEKKCSECSDFLYCDAQDVLKESIKEVQKDSDNNQTIINFFGRFCVASECGFMSDYVEEVLKDMSTFSCGHMG